MYESFAASAITASSLHEPSQSLEESVSMIGSLEGSEISTYKGLGGTRQPDDIFHRVQ